MPTARRLGASPRSGATPRPRRSCRYQVRSPKKTRRSKGPWTRPHSVSARSPRVRWIVGLECDGKGQIPAGSERGQHPQHFTLHLLDPVSCSRVLSSPSCPFTHHVISPRANLLICFRVVLLLLSSGYIGLRIVALEEQLTLLGALPEFTLQSG